MKIRIKNNQEYLEVELEKVLASGYLEVSQTANGVKRVFHTFQGSVHPEDLRLIPNSQTDYFFED